jgi:hypothetical protein
MTTLDRVELVVQPTTHGAVTKVKNHRLLTLRARLGKINYLPSRDRKGSGLLPQAARRDFADGLSWRRGRQSNPHR